MKKTWTIARTKDYISEPKSSGYRAVHHIVKRDGYAIEVQLRTFLQDAWANQVEEDSRKLGVGYKFGFGGRDVHQYYWTVAKAFAFMDREEEIPDDVIEEFNTRFQAVRDMLERRARRKRK